MPSDLEEYARTSAYLYLPGMCVVESEDAQVLTDLLATFTISCEQAAMTLRVSFPVLQCVRVSVGVHACGCAELKICSGSSFASQHCLHYYDGLPMDVDALERVSRALWHGGA